jgi:hypothetical protein
MAKKKEEPKLKIVGEQEEAPRQPEIAPIEAKLSFDAWWMMKAQSLKLKPELKNAVKKHFESRGFLQTGDFDKAIKDFGL